MDQEINPENKASIKSKIINAIRNKHISSGIFFTLIFICILTKSLYPLILLSLFLALYVGVDSKVKRIFKIVVCIFSVFCISLFTVTQLYPCFIKKTYLALINGQTIELEQYTVNLPFPEWFIYKRDAGAYTIMPDFNNKASIIVNSDAIEKTDSAPAECDFANVAIKRYAQIEGKELDCKEGETKFLLFLSNDDRFLLLSFLDRNDQELMRKYELLLNSVEKKP
jgi:energy-coupling factor transporter transmembrane protein EcfT